MCHDAAEVEKLKDYHTELREALPDIQEGIDHARTAIKSAELASDRAEALSTAALALKAGVDWLEAGTPFILAEGVHGVRALRERFPGVPIVADLKIMDGGYLETEMMAKAGATQVVGMGRAHEETLRAEFLSGCRYAIQPAQNYTVDTRVPRKFCRKIGQRGLWAWFTQRHTFVDKMRCFKVPP